MNPPGNFWYHCTGSTYGSWLRGEPKGWRARHHREHVQGDYKHPPPPDAHALQLYTSLQNMNRGQVLLNAAQCVNVCLAMTQKLELWKLQGVDLCVCSTHFHLLVRLPPDTMTEPGRGLTHGNCLLDGRDPRPRHILGRLKKHASHELRQSGLRIDPGGIWAKRTHVTPIENREHQLRVVRYIRDHANEGAAVWSLLKRESEHIGNP